MELKRFTFQISIKNSCLGHSSAVVLGCISCATFHRKVKLETHLYAGNLFEGCAPHCGNLNRQSAGKACISKNGEIGIEEIGFLFIQHCGLEDGRLSAIKALGRDYPR